MGDWPQQLGNVKRERDLFTALGVLYRSPAFSIGSSAVPTSQHVYGQAVYLYAGEVVTNIINYVVLAGAGTAPTALKLGLWSSAATPVCLALTADLAADARWTTTGMKANALTAPYTITASGIHYFTFWMNGAFGTTNMQNLVCGNGSAKIGSNPQFWGTVKTAAATLTVADTGTYGLNGNVPILMGS